MISRHVRIMRPMVIAAAVVSCLAVSQKLVAQNPATAPNVTYTASGIFGTTPLSGPDLYKMAGEPFTINVVANAATHPTKNGATWAQYTKLKLTGQVNSGLLPGEPYPITSNSTSMELATGNPSYDVFTIFAPVSVIGSQVNISSLIQMPPGTIKNALIHPFTAPVTLNPAVATVTYVAGGVTTTLSIASGTLNATIPTGAAQPHTAAQLYAEGVQTITSHGDGTATLRPLHGAPVDLSAQADVVALVFYGTGMRDASDVRLQIAGQDVPVMYAGASSHYPGLDEVNVQVPRSLAGSGAAEVVLIVDGQMSKPVQIQIQ